MAGIEDLKILLSSMKPELDSREFVFCTFDNPLSIRFDTVYKLISLTVHSSLNAVGLTAAIATKLASKDISANVVAAYYHDHIFVQKEKAGPAMEAIMELQAESFSCRE
ncbi:ACT domain-containing protein [Parabacteroides segnis]|uniref:ACT domain-containing protein n=1 Tax=Parabacteroides segnis TaxID=2763058 RepID=UPI003517C5F7